MSLVFNRLKSIEPSAFEPTSDLKVLSLQNNELTSLSSEFGEGFFFFFTKTFDLWQGCFLLFGLVGPFHVSEGLDSTLVFSYFICVYFISFVVFSLTVSRKCFFLTPSFKAQATLFEL